MKVSPIAMGFFYSLFGALFTYVAIQAADETVWNFFTILLALFATFDIGLAIRMFILHFKIKKRKDDK